MENLRAILALVLCLLLALAGQGMAFARGAAPAEGRAVLCIGAASLTLYVDAEGQPTAAPELCADCLPALGGLPQGPAPLASPSECVAVDPPPQRPCVLPAAPMCCPHARAPPLSV